MRTPWSRWIALWVRRDFDPESPRNRRCGNSPRREQRLNRHMNGLVCAMEKIAARILPEAERRRGLMAADLAMEYLLYLRKTGNWHLRHREGIERDMRRFFMSTYRKAQYELWEVTSDALRELEQKGEIRRLQKWAAGSVRNSDAWTLSGERPSNPVSRDRLPRSFQELAEAVWNRVVEDGGAPARINSRIVPLGRVRNFILGMLEEVGAPIVTEQFLEWLTVFADIFQECPLVVEGGDGQQPQEVDVPVPSPVPPRVYRHLLDEAEERGRQLGRVLCADELCVLFDAYTLKQLDGRKTRLDGIENQGPQANQRRVLKIYARIRTVLPLAETVLEHLAHRGLAEDAPSDDRLGQCRRLVFVQALHIAGEFCRKDC